jgi:hypothetical protein
MGGNWRPETAKSKHSRSLPGANQQRWERGGDSNTASAKGVPHQGRGKHAEADELDKRLAEAAVQRHLHVRELAAAGVEQRVRAANDLGVHALRQEAARGGSTGNQQPRVGSRPSASFKRKRMHWGGGRGRGGVFTAMRNGPVHWPAVAEKEGSSGLVI